MPTMKKILRHIEFLLMTHECVIIPGFGAVLSHSLEASYDSASGRWTPPTRAFAFNPELVHNDGLLAASIARREHISIAAASLLVDDAVKVMRRMLEAEGRVSLGMAGSISLESDGRMIFTPGNSAMMSPSLMWLPQVAAPLLPGATIESGNTGEDISRRMRLHRAMQRAGGWAACITIMVALAWITARNMGVDPGVQLASILPIEAEAEPAAEVEAAEPTPIVVVLATAPADEVIENIPYTPAPQPAPQNYCLIVASFGSRAEAEEYIAANKNLELELINKDGRWRVSAASGSTFQEAAAAADREPIASLYPSTWVCRR